MRRPGHGAGPAGERQPARIAQPWYRHKDDIAFEDMLAKLRRTLATTETTSTPDATGVLCRRSAFLAPGLAMSGAD